MSAPLSINRLATSPPRLAKPWKVANWRECANKQSGKCSVMPRATHSTSEMFRRSCSEMPSRVVSESVSAAQFRAMVCPTWSNRGRLRPTIANARQTQANLGQPRATFRRRRRSIRLRSLHQFHWGLFVECRLRDSPPLGSRPDLGWVRPTLSCGSAHFIVLSRFGFWARFGQVQLLLAIRSPGSTTAGLVAIKLRARQWFVTNGAFVRGLGWLLILRPSEEIVEGAPGAELKLEASWAPIRPIWEPREGLQGQNTDKHIFPIVGQLFLSMLWDPWAPLHTNISQNGFGRVGLPGRRRTCANLHSICRRNCDCFGGRPKSPLPASEGHQPSTFLPFGTRSAGSVAGPAPTQSQGNDDSLDM